MGAIGKHLRTALLILAVAFFIVALAAVTPAPAHAELTALPVSSPVLVDGKSIPFDAYNIEGNTYFKLRDLAYTLNGGAKSFEISFNSATKTISLTKGQPYTLVGGEMTPGSSDSIAPLPNESKVFLNGSQILLTAYNIGGNTYFKLRDIAKALDFSVEWDEQSGSILIDTGIGYGQMEAQMPLAHLPILTEELVWQDLGASLNEDVLGTPRRVLGEDADTQALLFGDYCHFTLICVDNGKVAYIYVNYDNHNKNAKVIYTDNNNDGKAYAAAAGILPVFGAHITEQLIFELTNAFRGYHTLSALRWNDTLSQVARNHSQDMARRNYFSHQSPEGVSPDGRLTKAGYPWTACAENIVAGYQNGVDAVDILINSAPHRKNMLTVNCDELGVGWVETEQAKYAHYGTQLFGST